MKFTHRIVRCKWSASSKIGLRSTCIVVFTFWLFLRVRHRMFSARAKLFLIFEMFAHNIGVDERNLSFEQCDHTDHNQLSGVYQPRIENYILLFSFFITIGIISSLRIN